MNIVLLLLALVGHAFLWVAMVNRTHSTAMPQWGAKLTMLLGVTMTAVLPPGLAAWFAWHGVAPWSGAVWSALPWPVQGYLILCGLVAPLAIVRWMRWEMLRRPPKVVRFHRSQVVDLLGHPDPPAHGDHDHHFLVRLPGNQMLDLELAERGLAIAGLPPMLDGLSVAHLSDLHFCGHVGKGYFVEAVDRCNTLEPDLIAITGDIADHDRFIEWIPDTLGRLRARYGVYFILGNHDFSIDAPRLTRAMTDCGLTYLGGRWLETQVRGQPVLLAGNELPWNAPAADLSTAPRPLAQGGPLRLGLAHSPDQLPWAQAGHVDLLLAGHLHGGQIRLPLVGAIFSPSRRGVRYAAGTFHDPPTVLHVSRGLSGEIPLRFNCPPEMTLLVLHSAPPRPAAERLSVR